MYILFFAKKISLYVKNSTIFTHSNMDVSQKGKRKRHRKSKEKSIFFEEN